MSRVPVREAPTNKVAETHLRPDIQGLRALAVLLVISDHLLAYPSGGFIGVDVFFVISGFVITGSLLRDHSRRGRISFADFYRRRARRILPLSALVLVTTLAATWAIYTTSRAWRITEDGIWSALFSANWHFALSGTNYMNADGVISPLKHYWSLAVEEQFYLVWPWLIVLVLGFLAARMNWTRTKALAGLGVALALVSAASFGFAMWETAVSPTFAYFSTISRAWELGAGALLAVFTPALLRLPAALRPALAWLGLAGILVGAVAITPQSPFPGPWAAVPVLATALVIAAGTSGGHAGLALITNPVMRYLGDISYSLYLWHFPVIILLGAIIPVVGTVEHLLMFAITVALSALSYFFLEEPIRHSNWLEPARKKKEKLPAGTARRLGVGGVIAVGIVTTVVVGVAMSSPKSLSDGATPSAPVTSAAEQTARVQSALMTETWPDLDPSIDQLGVQAKAPEWVVDGCLGEDDEAMDDPVENAQRCVYGDPSAGKTAVVMGDSMAISYVPGIRAALEPQGYKVLVHTLQQCPAETVTVLMGDRSPHPICDEFRRWAIDNLRAIRPDLVIMTSDHGVPLADGATEDSSVSEWAAGAKATFDRLAGFVEKTVVLTPPPGGESLDACATRVSTPEDCITETDAENERIIAALKTEAEETNADVSVVDTTDWFCSEGRCPAFVGTTPVYADDGHLTSKFSASLALLMAEAFGEQ